MGTSCFALAHAVFLFVSGFGDYRVFLDTICEFHHPPQPGSTLTRIDPRIAFTLCAISRLPAAVSTSHTIRARVARVARQQPRTLLTSQAFFVHRVYALYNKNTLIPIVLAPLLYVPTTHPRMFKADLISRLASAASAFAVTATLDQYPVPLLSRQLIWVMVSYYLLSSLIPLCSPCSPCSSIREAPTSQPTSSSPSCSRMPSSCERSDGYRQTIRSLVC